MKETIKTLNLNRHLAIREKVMLLTGYTDLEMNQLIFDSAVAYMKKHGMCEDWLAIWLKESVFWNWWRQQWTLVDEMFWHQYESYMGRDSVKPKLKEYYIGLHSNIDYFPDAIVYEKIHASYEIAGQKILRKIRTQNNV